MAFLKSVEIPAGNVDLSRGHPFDVPAIASMVTRKMTLRIDPALTVFVGDHRQLRDQ